MEDKLFNDEMRHLLAGFRLKTENTVQSAYAGLRKSQARGSSIEFSDYREYLLGDDVRHLDWNAYARLGKLYMKLFLEEREGVFHLFLDKSKSMDYGQPSKLYKELQIAAVISFLALSNQDRIIFYEKGGRKESFHGSQSFYKVLDYLQGLEATETETGWLEEIKRQNIPHYGTVFLFSDFFEKEKLEEILKYLRLYRKQSIRLIQVLAKEELHPELEGTKRLIDSESGEKVQITMTPSLLKAYHKNLERFFKEISTLSERYQCFYESVQTDDPLIKVLYGGINQSFMKK